MISCEWYWMMWFQNEINISFWWRRRIKSTSSYLKSMRSLTSTKNRVEIWLFRAAVAFDSYLHLINNSCILFQASKQNTWMPCESRTTNNKCQVGIFQLIIILSVHIRISIFVSVVSFHPHDISHCTAVRILTLRNLPGLHSYLLLRVGFGCSCFNDSQMFGWKRYRTISDTNDVCKCENKFQFNVVL